MSIRALTALAVERDRADEGAPALGGKRGTAAPPAAPAAGPDAEAIPQSFVDTLTSAIPTEPLVAYTAVVGIVTAAIGTDTRGYLPFRWCAFVVFLVLIAAAVIVSYRAKATTKDADGIAASKRNARDVPVLELATALVAGGTWGMAMPGGPLSATFTGPMELIATGSTVVVGAFLVTLAAGPLKTGTDINRGDAPAGRDNTADHGTPPEHIEPPAAAVAHLG